VHLVQILLPLYDNEGSPIPQLQFRRVSQEMTDGFGGLTAFTRAPAEGMWRDGGEKTSHDEIIVFEVMTEHLDRPWWAGYREELERRFRQEVIVIRAQEIEQL
jgi:hypothetical protein